MYKLLLEKNPSDLLTTMQKPRNFTESNKLSKNQIIPLTCCESLCCDSKYCLTVFEYESFIQLKQKIIIPYSETQENEDLLMELLAIIKEIELFKNSQNIDDTATDISNDFNLSIWKKIGFQGENPRTDFRAGGLHSLHFIIYFIKNYEEHFKQMINTTQYFLFAAIAIKVSFLINLFLYLDNYYDLNDHKRNLLANHINECKRIHLKAFIELFLNKNNFLYELDSQTLIFVFKCFIKKYNENQKELNFLLTEPIIKTSIQIVGESLSEYKIVKDKKLNSTDINFFDILRKNFDYQLNN